MKAGLATLGAAMLAGCAAAPSRIEVAPLFADASFAPPADLLPPEEIFAISPSMREYLAQEISRRVVHDGGPQGLVEALRGELRIDYDAAETRTAAQTFEARAGNCLSLVIMTAAFARQLGIPVTYRSVYGYDTWSRVGGFAVLSGHVNLMLGPHQPDVLVFEHSKGPRSLIVDFVPPEELGRQYAREIEETTVVAMFYNNRAVETLLDGEVGHAYWWARAAMMADPGFLSAYNTLGLIYRHHGDPAQAERVLRAALGCDKGARWTPAELTEVVNELLAEAPKPQKVYGT
ncbi:MAG: transglutaminase domain-containing protein [Sinobacteraceae bacterium]|nr:transglutaminase domain-containing protein [Nevskiaceae bacterium]